MASNQQPPQQMREYKDFTTVTSIRKAVQQSIAPTIKTLELQLSGILEQHQDINRKLTKMEDIFKNQANLDKRIQETNKIISDYKEQHMQKRKEDERKSSRLDTANEKLFIELHALKTKTESQDEIIQQITFKNNKTNQMYSALSSTNEKTLKQVQQKFSNFTKQLLEMSKDIKSQHNQIQSEIDTVRQTFKSQREALQQKAKPLQLYLSERQSMNDKFHDIFDKLMQNVTKQDFEGYRKSQLILFKDKINQIQSKIQKILPQSLRKLLPTIEKKMMQIDKIKNIEKYCGQLQNSLKEAELKVITVRNEFNLKFEAYEEKAKQQSNRIEKQLSNKLFQIERMQKKTIQQFEQRIQQMKVELQQQVSIMIEKQTSEIHKTIEAQVASNNNRKSISDQAKSQQPQLITQMKADEILAQLGRVQEIKQKIFGRYNKIEQLGRSIEEKIQGYSSKITKIKSDYQLFSENMRRQMSGVIKFRDTFLERLMDVGGLLSTFAEALLINTSMLIQNEQKQKFYQQKSQHPQSKQQITFVTQNDGIIYQWRPENPNEIIQYRKQKLEARQFLHSFMYSLTTFIDDQFTSLDFLNWNEQKPSEFFHQRLLNNYFVCIKRRSQSKNLQKQVHSHKNRRLSFNSTNQISQNQNSWIASDVDQQNTAVIDPSGSTKQFSRTIDSKVRLEKTLQQGNFVNTNLQINKNYSIKRQKPLSGKPKSKPKADNGLARYDQVFLTSRSACRSRLSQMF